MPRLPWRQQPGGRGTRVAGSAAVGLKRHPDASSQGLGRGALSRAAHRQALRGQGARCAGADGGKLRREGGRPQCTSRAQAEAGGTRCGPWDILSVRTPRSRESSHVGRHFRWDPGFTACEMPPPDVTASPPARVRSCHTGGLVCVNA